MDGATQPSDVGPEGGDPTGAAEIVLPSISRRRFATVAVGAGSLVVAGGALAGPRITSIRFGQKAAVGSPPPGPSTTSTTIAGQGGAISVSSTTPCAGDDLTVKASGFAPKTAVTLEIDSPANTLGVTTCDAKGQINTIVKLPASGPTGAHQLLLVGVAPGGRTLTLHTPVNIKTVEECAIGPEGSTSTTSPPTNPTTVSTSTPTSTVPPTTPTTTGVTDSGGPPTRTGGGLAFTGTDTTELALLGAAAAIAGRMLYGVAAGRGDDDDDDDDDETDADKRG